MKNLKSLLPAALLLIGAATSAAAQTSSTGTLTVTATISSSINMVFQSDASGVALTGSGTNAATLAFGTVYAFGGTLTTGVTRSAGASSFTISSPVDIVVTRANSTSANYTLKAQLGTADATNTWLVNAVTITNASAATISSTVTYTTANPFTIGITIPFTESSGAVTNTINFTATAN